MENKNINIVWDNFFTEYILKAKIYYLNSFIHVKTLSAALRKSGHEVKKTSYETQLSMKFFLLINVKMPTIVGILTFMSMEKSIPGLSEPEKS